MTLPTVFSRADVISELAPGADAMRAYKPSVAAAARRHRVAFIPVANSSPVVCCLQCGRRWGSPPAGGRRLPARWWACPEGCNEDS